MRKAFNCILLWLVLFLAFSAFACTSVPKGGKEASKGAAVTKSQTNTTGTGKAKAGSTETVKKKASSNETGKSKQGTLAGLKEEVIMEAEKIITPSIRKAIIPSGVGLLILASLMSSIKERSANRRKRYQ